MDMAAISEALGMAATAVGLTGKATTTLKEFKALFDNGKTPDSSETSELLNKLAIELTTTNMTNVQLSENLRAISQELQKQNEFETEKARYELFETAERDIVFKLKEDKANGQPIHYICPVCLNKDKLISFIAGEGDFKVCQNNKDHCYQFKNEPIQQGNFGDYNPY